MAQATDGRGDGNLGLQMRCQRCGLHFENRMFINARGPSQGVKIAGNAVGCPRRGSGGVAVQLVDGEYNVDDQRLWSLVRAVQARRCHARRLRAGVGGDPPR